MKPVKITDLNPEKAPIILHILGETKEFMLKPKSLSDDAWVAREWGDAEAIEKVFKNFEAEKIARLLFRVIEPKEPLEGRDVEDWDDDGKKITRFKPGWEILLDGIQGQKHLMDVFKALMKTWGVSMPLVDESDKKKPKPATQKLN